MSGVEKTSNPITKDAAARIQSNEAKNGKDTCFDSRAQAAADKNANEAAK
ncbi:uncharacterized protein FFB20_12986 [Fusarium fujikuroi]|uniref:SMP domain-containing protein n=1 Tax=Gibberella fujikuroi (strain CBS 195.34 / IMI 58289 / NRRL A-6831) TaxID=1279085 RepID=S0E9I3_GIBF5|nr:uncharacterized protein FFUJ_08376 [Fusarium fujikuroi IMI 58289]KLO93318.1 Uncharacterized protein LW93_6316 [Fusarium fujikuroi]KLO94014.1 Uncharacterized protein LW94_9735 [Fusarium fujikuroi]KLP00495.1 Uncharacterized protein Y057_11050 [Fusarium fujikuroi]QGI67290.1 hypothetical protein CEK27_011261 [Fusarium fujikuroi]QGI84521.1 hypothetical protein CEK25_011250 [Fusarium fujikuroi]